MRYIDYLYQIGDREKWQYTSLEVKFFTFDWRLICAFIPVIFFMFSIYSYILALSIVLFCQFLKMRGMELHTLLRLIKFKLVGKRARATYKYERRTYRS